MTRESRHTSAQHDYAHAQCETCDNRFAPSSHASCEGGTLFLVLKPGSFAVCGSFRLLPSWDPIASKQSIPTEDTIWNGSQKSQQDVKCSRECNMSAVSLLLDLILSERQGPLPAIVGSFKRWACANSEWHFEWQTMALAELPLPLQGKHTPGLLADNEEEYFDVVDDDNQIIGRERRSDVHATGLKHRAVYCFVLNKQGKLLLQQRSPRQAPLQLHPTCSLHAYSNSCVRLRQ